MTLSLTAPRLAALLALLLTACDRAPSAPPGQAPADDPTPDACAPLAQLAAMDPRQPVPLQPMMAWHQKQNMMDHLVAIQQITDALAREDWQGITAASTRIGLSPNMQQQCEHMGAGADGFTALALDFHQRADAIGAAAQTQDAKAVLQATSHTLQACTQCHATYRQDVVDADSWQARTNADHAP